MNNGEIVSEPQKERPTFDETMAHLDKIGRFLEHYAKHTVNIQAKIKAFDKDCEMCQGELKRIARKSDNDPPSLWKGTPDAKVAHTTILCFLGEHNECCKYYIMEDEKIQVECLCECHLSKTKAKQRRLASPRRRR